MNEQIKAAWIAALRSGEYKQATGALRTDEGFCCLGVLCDLHAKMTGNHWVDVFYFENSQVLPQEVVVWAELREETPNVEDVALTVLNDGDTHYDDDADCEVEDSPPHTFAEIADLIEAHL